MRPGSTAPNPVLSTIKYFREEYQSILKTNIVAGVCSELFISPCENSCPANVNIPGYISLIASGRFICIQPDSPGKSFSLCAAGSVPIHVKTDAVEHRR